MELFHHAWYIKQHGKKQHIVYIYKDHFIFHIPS